MKLNINSSFLNLDAWAICDDRIEIYKENISNIGGGWCYLPKEIRFDQIDGISVIWKHYVGPYMFEIMCGPNNAILNTTSVTETNFRKGYEHILETCNLKKKSGFRYLSDINLAKYYEKNSSDKANQIASKLAEEIASGQLNINRNVYELLSIYKQLEDFKCIDKIQENSIIIANEFATSFGFEDFSITKVRNSTFDEVIESDYFYCFDENNSLHLLEIPLKNLKIYLKASTYGDYKYTTKTWNIKEIKVFDYEKSKLIKPIVILEKDIKDFEVTGIQVSSINSSSSILKPSIFNTIASEILFGSSFTILNGLSKNLLNINSKIEDLRSVQLILNNKKDVNFLGISIYYDFKRIFGGVKNKEKTNINQLNNEENIEISSTIKSRLIELKSMFDDGLITIDEFNQKKKQLLEKL